MYDSRYNHPRGGVHWLRENRLQNALSDRGVEFSLFRYERQLPAVDWPEPEAPIVPMSVQCFDCKKRMRVEDDNEVRIDGKVRMACDWCLRSHVADAVYGTHDGEEFALTDCPHGCKVMRCHCGLMFELHFTGYGCKYGVTIINGDLWECKPKVAVTMFRDYDGKREVARPRKPREERINWRSMMMPGDYRSR